MLISNSDKKYQQILKKIKLVRKIRMLQNIIKTIIFLLPMGILCFSCAGRPEVGITESIIYSHPVPIVEYEYELGSGDVIEIVYHYTPKPETGAYYLSVGDIFRVEFLYHNDINRELTVRPDGSISMPRKGSVRVLGLTPNELEEKLAKIYSDAFKDPVVSIMMIQYNRAIEHLKKAITTSARGQSKLTTVRPDGYISFPIIHDVMAKGKSVPELKAIVSKEYQKHIDNLTVTIILKVMTANIVYVMGEVAKPDSYLMEGQTSVTQILAKAGGILDSAEKTTTLIISRDEKRRPWGRLLNLEEVIYNGDISQDIILNQYDIVYVPKSKIARRNLFVQQYINRLIPSNMVSQFEFGGSVFDRSLIK